MHLTSAKTIVDCKSAEIRKNMRKGLPNNYRIEKRKLYFALTLQTFLENLCSNI